MGSPRQVLLSGMLYALGRSLAYLALGMLLVASMLSIPQLSLFLQKYMNKLLGPILIVVAMFLLGLIQLNITGPGVTNSYKSVWTPWGCGRARAGCPVRFAVLPRLPHSSSAA